MLKLGLIGLGAIGVDVEKMVAEEYEGKIEIPAILVKNPRKTNPLINQLLQQISMSFLPQNQTSF